MYREIVRYISLCAMLLLVVGCRCGSQSVTYRGWSGCVKLTNGVVDVVVNPSYGGNILHYGFVDGENILWADSVVNGWSLKEYRATKRSPDAGRFDIGYERKSEHIHDQIWAGSYRVLSVDSRSLHIISEPSREMGIEVERIFELDSRSSQLVVTQRMRNITTHAVEYCFWSRNLFHSGGEYWCNITPTQRYCDGYSLISLSNDELLPCDKSDLRIKSSNDQFVCYPSGEEARYGLNTLDGVCHYKNRGVIYTKHYSYDNTLNYENNNHEAFANMIYFNDDFLEMEPHSPIYNLNPDDVAEYIEWWTLSKI